MKKIKVFQIIPKFVTAGAETMCENLSEELIKLNVDLTIISLYKFKSDITKRLEDNNIKIIYLDKKRGLDLSIIFKIKKIIDKLKPDIIHTHLYVLEYVVPAVILSKYKKIKIVHTIHNIASMEAPKRLQFFQRIFFKKKMVYPVAISEKVNSSIRELYGIKYAITIYNGVNLAKCKIKKSFESCHKIVHIGRFENQKNHIFLINLFKNKKIYENFELYLVGDGSLKQNIEEMIKTYNLEEKIHLVGNLPDCYEMLYNSDIFILPSKWEGMPMTIVEAMGTGIPIVASPVGGIPDMIKNGENGFLCNTIDEYEKILIKLKNDENLRKKISKNEIKSSENFSSKKMAQKYYEYYLKGEMTKCLK